MGRPCTEEEKTLLISHRNHEVEDEEEEETLSLSDLPVNSSNEKVELPKQSKEEEEFEFETGSSFRLGSDSCEPAPEMSTADELFSEGRILPFRRHSVSLDAGLSGSNRLICRSESVDFRGTGSNRKIKNSFIDYSQPSPQPQIIRRSSSMTARVNSIRNSKSSSIWDFLRLGLVRTPEITVSNARVSVSRNSSCSSTSTSSNSKKTGESRSRNRRSSFLFGDCKCSAATETIVPVKINVSGETEKKMAKKEEKTAVARKRTFEWLKELSQVGFVVDHGRRSLA
ncbi:hypothetical protein Bca4012_067833 [Brassica carinata]|uniref:Uncharacterized protein n=1 Tax=Brassica carinata TaxID=52824 RepID=A0A8X7VSX3_BRACI|nr:hypothetical protein Bca52824_020063 [Brassica carinata]